MLFTLCKSCDVRTRVWKLVVVFYLPTKRLALNVHLLCSSSVSMFCSPFPCWAHGLLSLVTTCVQSSCHLFAKWCFHHSSVYHAGLWSCVLLLPSVRLPHFYLLHLLYHHCFFLTNSACYWPWSRFIPGLTVCGLISRSWPLPVWLLPSSPAEQTKRTTRDTILITGLWRATQEPCKTLPWHQIWWCISRFILMSCILNHCLYAKRVRSVRVWVKMSWKNVMSSKELLD